MAIGFDGAKARDVYESLQIAESTTADSSIKSAQGILCIRYAQNHSSKILAGTYRCEFNVTIDAKGAQLN